MEKDRYLTPYIVSDLKEKMVFIGGPRQVGKTTLAREMVAPHFKGTAYHNWDNPQDRRRIMASNWPANVELLILDEIHKLKGWKRLVKGNYDVLKGTHKFLITGSARLDIFRKGGDSLMGRYHYHVLHPFSLAEMHGKKPSLKPFDPLPIGDPLDGLDPLDRFGGFPEPLFAQSDRTLRRWHSMRNDRLLREDIRDVEVVRDISLMQLLADMLPTKVGSLLSVNAIREDLEVSHRAVARWLEILETFYYHFRIYPYAGSTYRSLKKEPKLYLWDWSEITDHAARFENLLASHLHKFVHWWKYVEGHDARLHFLRDASHREVDFLVTIDKKPWFTVEAKLQDDSPSSHIKYFRERLRIPFNYQVVRRHGVDRSMEGIRVVSADRFLSSLF